MGKRVFLIVLDSFGIGAAPDAKKYNDEGANTLKAVSKSKYFNAPNLKKLGLFNIEGVDFGKKSVAPIGCFARMQELSAAKDTTHGHWEIAGIISEKPMPTYPLGFSEEVINKLQLATGRKVVCNKPYSGTQVILDYGEEHIKSGNIIVYTSADSVMQIAAHESVISLPELYEICQKARDIMQGDDGVGRIIARPFVGRFPDFVRTQNRRDFSLSPPKDTILDVLDKQGYDTIAVGKISDIFCGRGIDESVHTSNNYDGMQQIIKYQDKRFEGLCFVNLMDFDSLYGHRNNVDGYATAVSEFDVQLSKFLDNMQKQDILIITADHGCDPSNSGTDHTREYVPMLMVGESVKSNLDLKTRKGFCDIGSSICEIFGLENTLEGKSFWSKIKKDD